MPVSTSKYRRHVLRARDTSSYFTFTRAYVWIMSKYEALFLQDLINLFGSSDGHKWVDENGKEWNMCTVEYLKESLNWDPDGQIKLLNSLKEKGFIDYCKRGLPPKRWVYVDIEKIEDALDNYENSKKPQESPNAGDHRPTITADPRPTNTVNDRSSIYKKEELKEKDKTIKGDKRLSKYPKHLLDMAEQLSNTYCKRMKCRNSPINLYSTANGFKKLVENYGEERIQNILNHYSKHQINNTKTGELLIIKSVNHLESSLSWIENHMSILSNTKSQQKEEIESEEKQVFIVESPKTPDGCFSRKSIEEDELDVFLKENPGYKVLLD